MFKWLYRRIIRGVVTEFADNSEEYLGLFCDKLAESEKFGSFMTLTTDAMIKRGLSQLQSASGGIMKGVSFAAQQELTEANPLAGMALKFVKGGKFGFKDAIGGLIQMWLSKQTLNTSLDNKLSGDSGGKMT